MGLWLITPPTSEPVTLNEIKEHLQVDHNNDDRLLESYIQAARHLAENYTKRQLMPATWKYIMDDFKCSTCAVELMRPPLSTVASNVSIQYTDNTNSTNTVAATVYTVDFERTPGRVYPTYNNEWPENVLSDHPKSVEITYVSGYANRASVPQPIKNWIMMKVGDMYEYRETLTPDSYTRVPADFTMGLLDPYKIIRFAT